MADIKDYIKRLQNGTVSIEEQQLALSKIEETIKIAKQKRDEAVGQKADMVVAALKQIETRLNEKYEELLQTPAMVGEQGPRGPAGRDGKDGLNGRDGEDGVDGKDGKDGVDGVDGISVVDARVDFDGGLVITLSDGSEIDAGQIFSPEVAQNIQVFRGGGGTSLPDQSGNSGKYLTTNGSELSWATVSGGGGGSGTVTSVAMSVPTGLTVSGSPITTNGTLAVSYTAGYAIPTTAKQTEWDTAYSWGNHSSAGYITTETDPVFVASEAYNITSIDTANWDAAYNDKVNSAAFNTSTGVLTLTQQDGGTVTVDLDGRYLTSETDSQTLSWNGATGELSISSGNTVDLDGRYLTSYTETDPIYTASSWYTTTNNSTNWNTAYGWGNHASAGYLDSGDIGVSVQAYDADLTTWAGKTAPTGTVVGTTDTQTLSAKTLEHPIITGTVLEDVYTITDGAGFAIDPTNGSIQLITLGASRTPTAANWDAGEGVTLMVNDGTAYTITWTTIGVTWVGGVAPTLSTTGYTVIELWKVGSTIYGALVGSVA